MKKVRKAILILLALLALAGTLLLFPMVRFSLLLRVKRFDGAETVYLSSLSGSDQLSAKAEQTLKRYADGQLEKYYERKLTYEEVMAILQLLSGTELPQDDVAYCLFAATEMEAARNALLAADAAFDAGDYARAIPLYRLGLIADENASGRLHEAEGLYRSRILDAARAAMDSGDLTLAEKTLLDAQSILGADDADLVAALADVHRMEADAAYGATMTEARRLLQAEGPGAAMAYLAGLRSEQLEDYTLEYLEQTLLHEYEEDLCLQARALWEGGDGAAACALLETGLGFLDSAKMTLLLGEIRGTILYLLGDMPVLRDDTASPRTGAESTVARDAVLMDARGNRYSHSFSADAGSVTFDLVGRYAVFAGTVACVNGEGSDIYRTSATLQIYGDGVLLATFKNVTNTTAPADFSLSVTGVRELTLLWTSDGANGWKDWGRFATVFDGRFMTAVPSADAG